MANRILEPAPRDEGQIIRDALRSGMFLSSCASTRSALTRHVELMEANAKFRQVQERRRSMEEARAAQMDYDRQLGETAQRRIAPLQTFNHQMNNRRRIAQQILSN